MKKWLLLVVGCMFLSGALSAQTWSEWWSQKKTQIKYLGQQIAALKVYTGYLEKGYAIAKDGLAAIHDIKTGDFNLHSDYFNSLKLVRPAIRDTAKLSQIWTWRQIIITEQNKCVHAVSSSEWMEQKEVEYIKTVGRNLLALLDQDMDELNLVTTDGTVQMKDDERSARVEKIYQAVRDKYQFVRHFNASVQKLSRQRTKEWRDIKMNKALQGR